MTAGKSKSPFFKVGVGEGAYTLNPFDWKMTQKQIVNKLYYIIEL